MPGGGDDHYPRDVCLPRGSGLRGPGRWNLYAGLLEVTVLLFNKYLFTRMCVSILLKQVWFNHYMVINFWGLYQDIASVLIVGRGGEAHPKYYWQAKKIINSIFLSFFLNLEFRILLQYSTHEYNNYGVSYNIFQETLNPSDSKSHDYVFLSKSNSLLKKGNLRHGDIVSIK